MPRIALGGEVEGRRDGAVLTFFTELVIDGSLVGIGEGLVGFGDFLESEGARGSDDRGGGRRWDNALFGRRVWVVRVPVRVML